MSVTVEELAAEVGKILDAYGEEVYKILDKAAKQTAKETNEEIKKNVEFRNRTGQYVRNFATKKWNTEAGTFRHHSTNYVWYVKAPYYRLTHLLEHGHATRNGGRTQAYPHIAKGEEYAKKRLDDLLEELLDALF